MTKRAVYLDNAATTPVRPEVLEAMLPYLGSDAFGNPSSAHRFGRAARAGIEAAKRQVAEAVGGGPSRTRWCSRRAAQKPTTWRSSARPWPRAIAAARSA